MSVDEHPRHCGCCIVKHGRLLFPAESTAIAKCSVTPLTRAHVTADRHTARLLKMTAATDSEVFVWSVELATVQSDAAHRLPQDTADGTSVHSSDDDDDDDGDSDGSEVDAGDVVVTETAAPPGMPIGIVAVDYEAPAL